MADAVAIASGTDDAFVDRFAGLGDVFYSYPGHPGAPSESATRAMLAPDHPTTARCRIELFIASDRNAGSGRVAAIVNPRLSDEVGLLGFFECADDPRVATALLDAACEHLRDLGCTVARGPMCFTTWHDYRYVVRDLEPGWIPGEPYHPIYYPRLWEQAGFTICSRYRSNWMGDAAALVDAFAPAARQSRAAGVTVRPMGGASDAGALFEISGLAFADAYMFSPIDPAEFAALYSPDRVRESAAGVYIAEHESDGPVGFLYTVDGLFPRRGDVSAAKTICVRPDWRGRGVYKHLLRTWYAERLADGVTDFVAALMHHDGSPRKMGWTDDNVIREYALYERAL